MKTQIKNEKKKYTRNLYFRRFLKPICRYINHFSDFLCDKSVNFTVISKKFHNFSHQS